MRCLKRVGEVHRTTERISIKWRGDRGILILKRPKSDVRRSGERRRHSVSSLDALKALLQMSHHSVRRTLLLVGGVLVVVA